jgi:hypothetical protein
MAGELEQLDALLRDFNADAADRRAVAAAVANAYTNGQEMAAGTVATVGDMLAHRASVTEAVTAIEAASGPDVFTPELGLRG